MPRADTDAFKERLAVIAQAVAAGSHAAIIVDGAGWHVGEKLVVPDTITLVKLPPYAPELNGAENIWEYLRKNKLALRVYESYEAIVDVCCAAWNDFMAAPERIASIAAREWAFVSSFPQIGVICSRWRFSATSGSHSATFYDLALVGQLNAALGDYGVEGFDVGDVLVDDRHIDDLP